VEFATLLGFISGIGCVGYILIDGDLVSILKDLAAIIFVFGGTFASTLMTYPWRVFKKIPIAVKMTFFPPKIDPFGKTIDRMCELTDISLQNGIDELPARLTPADSDFLKTGVNALINNWDNDDIKKFLQESIDAAVERHTEVRKLFESMGSYAPIYGLLGTLIGVLGLLRFIGDPQAMGAAMGKAITTFYGIFFANFVALPTAGKLESYCAQEQLQKKLIMEGIISIKNEVPSYFLRDKLEILLSQAARKPKK
jgi:chemotaxis protein MotA